MEVEKAPSRKTSLRICEKKSSWPREHKRRCSASFSLTDQVPGEESTNVPEASEACIDVCSVSSIFLQRIMGSLGKVYPERCCQKHRLE
ncbi:hypothetical protein I7I53_02000 [Histoplasma capsulatum var. duboisii H88]|uniref:Uncharacterized protein n=1 Tax=Ajellomyces capsulatus (strain H88) TaxID=544711 RepID=A0A8A1LPC5_AJEC8|nr:hypothetical protein I7I53_02000 [Histoplasma capsulatum var. duboisii H88]